MLRYRLNEKGNHDHVYTIEYQIGEKKGTKKVRITAEEADEGVDPIQKFWSRIRHSGKQHKSAKIINDQELE